MAHTTPAQPHRAREVARKASLHRPSPLVRRRPRVAPERGARIRAKNRVTKYVPRQSGDTFCDSKTGPRNGPQKRPAYGPHRWHPDARATCTATMPRPPKTAIQRDHKTAATTHRRLRHCTTTANEAQGPQRQTQTDTLHDDSWPRAPCHRHGQRESGLTANGTNSRTSATRCSRQAGAGTPRSRKAAQPMQQ